ncbi:MAG: CRISPR-associated endonuclease Cas3'', partial [bacterium]
MSQKILAKSSLRGLEITLSEHTASVYKSAVYLFGTVDRATGLAQKWLKFFQLGRKDFERFLIHLYLSCLLHDIGKANDGFQAALHRQGEQAIRHEHLSGLLLFKEPLREWLLNSEIDVEIIISAVISHHLKVDGSSFAKRLTSNIDCFHVYTEAPEFLACLQMVSIIIGSNVPNLSELNKLWSFKKDVDPWKGPSGDFGQSMHQFKRQLRSDEIRRRMLCAVKAGLIAADSAGSALVREGRSLEGWIKGCFESEPLTPDWIDKKIIQARILEIEKKTGKAFQWHDFQTGTRQLEHRALLLSGCGTGKTLAAWNWVKSQVRHHPSRRVLFLYPTRGTATEGFRDYVSWAGGEEGTLLHGTASYDLEGLFENPEDARQGKDYLIQERLFALAYWPKRVFSATVDSFLAFIRNQYASLCLLPVLVDSIVVIDEIHSFDPSMFTALENFLKFFDLPVLCMTASLPPDRLETLQNSCGLEVFPRTKEAFSDLKKQAELPRYQIISIAENQVLKLVKKLVSEDKTIRILWVVNKVRRCQEKSDVLMKDRSISADIYCYHS